MASTVFALQIYKNSEALLLFPDSNPSTTIIFRILSPPKKSEKQLAFSAVILLAILASIGTLSGLVLNGK
jgi:hypothetical protein